MKSVILSLFVWVSLLGGCAEKRTPFHLDTSVGDTLNDTNNSGIDSLGTTDRDTEIIKDTVSDQDSDTIAPVETDNDSGGSTDTDSTDITTDSTSEIQLGTLGDPCWIPVFSSTHPNAGLQDCEEPYQCIGDSTEAWCTESCTATGDVSSISKIEGWCCAEVGSACDPSRYFVPETMSVNCAPRTLSLGDACTSSGDLRCAAVCNDTDIVYNSVCIQLSDGGLCSFPCLSNSDCVSVAAFANGCCGTAMGGNYCMTEISDRCL